MDTEIVKMSPKGQLVVPQEIREMEHFKPGDRFISVPLKEGVLFKRVEIPDLKVDFKKLLKETREYIKKKGIKTSDVDAAFKRARKR